MLHVHRADRAAGLVGDLAELLRAPVAGSDPFAPELVAVPSRGIERWLAQELSLRLGARPGEADGVCANVVFPFPATIVQWAVDHGGGDPVDLHRPDRADDPWSPDRLTWTVLDVLASHDLDLGAFGAHVAGDAGRVRRLPAVRHVADLFDRYAVHRPAMVRAWHAGHDVDGLGAPLVDGALWQPRLWRAVRSHLGRPSFAERVGQIAADGLGPDGVPGLPRRLCLYGLTALPASYVEVLDALAVAHDVHVFLLHPSPGQWERLAPAVAGLSRPARRDDPTRERAAHPLVRSWGRDSRELQVVLAGRGVDRPIAAPPAAAPMTLLSQVAAQVRADVAPEGRPVIAGQPDLRPVLAADDRSLVVHACHGRLRQVEVMRDAVLRILSDDPTIQPRDIVVMCPDVEAFAPLVDAVFGADARVDDRALGASGEAGSGLPDIRVRLADRSLRQVNPLLRTVADLLLLPDGRMEATTLVDLARRGPVRTCFGWDEGDLTTVEDWIQDVGIRWGLDLDHRRENGLDTDQHTWQRGLDRLLVGVAVAEDGARLVAGVLPHDDVEGSTVDLVGRLAEFVARVGEVRRTLAAPRSITAWCDDLTAAVDLLTATEPDELWQRLQFDRLLADVRNRAGGDDAPDVEVTLTELRTLLGDQLRGRPSRANHRTGDLTVCTLVPMRSVPYRVVCLLGLDDESFPRRTTTSGDDLVADAPMVGDRDPRTEDRQLLLDALLAASDHVVITYQGRDPRSDAPVPPAVPIAELLDVVDATVRLEDGRRAREVVVRAHPLRAADPRTFDAAAADGPFGFDRLALEAAAATGQELPPRFLDALPSAAPRPTTVEWSDFVRFLQHPVRGWLRNRLEVSLSGADDPLDDLLPVALGGLDEWQVGTRLLVAALEGPFDDALAAEVARGTLPAGQIGGARLAEVTATIHQIRDVVAADLGDLLGQQPDPVDVDLRIGDLHLVGVVDGARPDVLARIEYGKPKPKRLLGLWLPWLALQAMGAGRPAVMVTRGKTPAEGTRLTTLPDVLDPQAATERLEMLVGLWTSGQEHPLAVFEECSGLFAAEAMKAGREDAIKKLRKKWVMKSWQPGSSPYGDGVDPSVVQVFGRLDLDELLEIAPLAQEAGDGWDRDEPSRFGRLALRLWGPVLGDVTSKGL